MSLFKYNFSMHEKFIRQGDIVEDSIVSKSRQDFQFVFGYFLEKQVRYAKWACSTVLFKVFYDAVDFCFDFVYKISF